MAKILSKTRSDIDDKFCKFEINKLVEVDETISIISDTWSTDVLASDSETIEPNDCERNFSTPLIPSAVILPGDNNFDPMNNSVSQLRANFLDASETRSESAWSTDVLASDSEKMTELDTDDNNSITANSDVTDAGRFDGELVRDVDILPPATNRSPDSPFFAARANAQFRTPDLLMYTPRSNDSVFSNRTFDEAAVIAAVAASPAALPRISTSSTNSPRLPSEEFSRFISPISLFPRNITNRDSNRYSDNAVSFRNAQFQQATDPYCGTATLNARMRRQNSAESSISNQSSNYDDNANAAGINISEVSKKVGEAKVSDYRFPDYSQISMPRGQVAAASADESIVKTSSNIINPFAEAENTAGSSFKRDTFTKRTEDGSDANVEQRHTSIEHRNNSFDGRRNGMSAFALSSRLTNPRQATSLNYENHEIIIKSKTKSLNVGLMAAAITDDDKTNQQDEFLLIQKTMALSLGESSCVENIKSDSGIRTNENGDSNEPLPGPSKPPRYTGTIPKSISFDETADKRISNHLRRNDPSTSRGGGGGGGSSRATVNGTSFFNKIKQGFRNRRSHKSRSDDFLPTLNHSGRNISLSAMDNAAGSSAAAAGDTTGVVFRQLDSNAFNDTSEDILAKYRRKISSSSEATNSDSIGNNRKNSQTDIDPRYNYTF